MAINEHQLVKEQGRGTEAEQLVENKLLQEAFENLKKDYTTAILQTKHGEDSQRSALWQAYHITDKVQNHLRMVMETGHLATIQLNQIKKNSTR